MSAILEMIPPAIEELVSSLFDFDEVESVILFGSRAHGDASPHSDVDLAISAPKMSRRRWLEMKKLAEEAPTLLSVTLVRLEDSPRELRQRILKEGIVLHERENGSR